MRAFAGGDATGVADLYTAGGQLLPSHSDVISGHEAITAFWKGAMEMGIASAALESVELSDLGDTAIETGHYTLAGSDGGVMDQGKYLVVWKNEDGAWKLHRDIWNTSLPPQT
jgi:uncharacterized protein (TIGR02246 family)